MEKKIQIWLDLKYKQKLKILQDKLGRNQRKTLEYIIDASLKKELGE